MKLEKLTKEQEEKMIQVKQYWLDYIFSCKNYLNREQAKISIDWLYKFCKLGSPIVIFVDSPMACQYAALYAKEWSKYLKMTWAQVGDQVGDQVRAQVWDQVGDQVRAQVGDQVRDQVRAQVGAQVWAQVWDQVGAQVRAQVGAQVRDQVWAQVWDQVWDQVGAQVGAQVRAQVGAQVRDQVGAQVRAQVGAQVRAQVWAQKISPEPFSAYGSITDYGWVSFYDFFTQIGVINHKDYNDFKNVLSSGIYDMIQLNGFCIVSDMPNKISRNSENRLHAINGPAISFKDGYSQYYVNGRTVPEEKYLKALSGKVTKDDWLQEKNEDVKAAWFEIIGSVKLIEVLGAEEIDSTVLVHANGEAEDLRLFKTPFSLPEIGEPLAWVKFICPSTGSNYLISVNPKHSKVMAAVLDTCPFFGSEIKSEEEYKFNARG